MSDSNVGLGVVPCRKNCRCDDCTIARQKDRIAKLESEVKRLSAERGEWKRVASEQAELHATDTKELQAKLDAVIKEVKENPSGASRELQDLLNSFRPKGEQ